MVHLLDQISQINCAFLILGNLDDVHYVASWVLKCFLTPVDIARSCQPQQGPVAKCIQLGSGEASVWKVLCGSFCGKHLCSYQLGARNVPSDLKLGGSALGTV